MKIYTKTGDDGTTGLLSGERVGKDSLRVEAYGCVDELQSAFGMARALNHTKIISEAILDLQRLLMLVMAELADDRATVSHYIQDSHVEHLELSMDELQAALPPLEGFIIAGNCPASASLDTARTVCRRAERQIWRLARQEPVGRNLLLVMNRLSDLCFLLSRRADQVLVDPQVANGS